MTSPRFEKYYPIILGLLAFVLYANALRNEYSIDDNLVTALNPQVQKGIFGIPEIFASNYTSGTEKSFEYRPLTKATFAVEYTMFGENTFVGHLINLLLYCTTCIVLYRLTLTLFNSKGSVFALVATLIFLAHPTHTEVVNSLKNREELLSFLFCLSSIVFFIKNNETKNSRFFILAAFFYVLALFTKLTCLPFLLIIPLCIYYSGTNNYKAPLYSFLALSLLTASFFVVTNKLLPGTYSREVYYIENPIVAEGSFSTIIFNALQTMWFYLKLYVWPHPLSFYYGYDMFPVAKVISAGSALAFLLHGFMLTYALLNLHKRDLLAFAFIFYLLNMSMYYNIAYPVPGIVSDRALYVSSFGFSLVIALALTRLSFKKMVLLCMLITIPASIRTFSRNADWKDARTLLSGDIEHLRRSVKANLEYASILRHQWENEINISKKNQLAKNTIHHYAQALKIKPDLANPYNEIGKILFNHYDQHEEAQLYFAKAIQMMGSKSEFHFNLATGYVLSKEYDKAEKYFLRTLEIEPEYTKAYQNLFLVYMMQEKLQQAFKINSTLMEKIPNEAYPHFNFGKYYLAVGDSVTAKKYFENALLISPGNTEIMSILQSLNTRP